MQKILMNNSYSKKQKIVIYTRNTAMEQPEGHRLYRDVKLLKNKYERLGYEIHKIYYEPSYLGETKEKTILQRLLKEAANGLFGVVLVWDVFTLTSEGEELQLIERELARYDVELCSATESFDTSTEEGNKVFGHMCFLLKHEHLATKQDVSLSTLARLIISRGASMKGSGDDAKLCGAAIPS
ncbi:recombinase family protein [Virgibacillus sp. L01]|uniref:recombinase family protein n=1 Tax=Virgibacillus sp. L01 TaxID=3457429 RepID=UPI003FD0AFAC